MKLAKALINEVVDNNVKISLISTKSNKEIRTLHGHNTGTIYICEYLRDALKGSCSFNDRPGLAMPCIKTSSGTLQDMLKDGIPYQGEVKDVEIENGAGATFTFLIPSTFSSNTPIDGFRLYRFSSGLNDRKRVDEDLYAEINLTTQEDYDPTDPLIIESGTNLKIEWTLSVRYE